MPIPVVKKIFNATGRGQRAAQLLGCTMQTFIRFNGMQPENKNG
jgi:hypothetical protein